MKKVAVIDSGSGGVNVLKALTQNCHGVNFLYLADEENAPYGQKTPLELQKIGKKLVEKIAFFDPEVIVIACNTLTCTSIDFLRHNFSNLKFIGCEPAIKPACQKYDESKVLVMATPTTLNENKLLQAHPKLMKLAIDNLPSLIDDNLFELDELIPLLKEKITPFNADAIVLGCTHFEAITKQISTFFEGEIFSSSQGIAKNLSRMCQAEGGVQCSFMSTGTLPPAKYFHYFNLTRMSNF